MISADVAAIKNFCKKLKRHFVFHTVTNNLLSVGIYFLSGGIALSAIFSIFPWVTLPILFDCLCLMAAAAALIVVITGAVIQAPSLIRVARLHENAIPREHHYISLALELSQEASAGSDQLVAAVCKEARQSLFSYPQKARNIFKWKRLYSFLGILGLCVIFGSFGRYNLISYWNIPFSLWAPVQAQIQPGSIAVKIRTTIPLRLIPQRNTYPSARLLIERISPAESQTGMRRQEYFLRPDSSGSFTFQTDSLIHSFIYRFSLGTVLLEPETITVVPKPSIYSLSVMLSPPVYTGKKEVKLPDGQGAIAAYPGTSAHFAVESHFPLKSALYLHENRDTTALSVNSRQAEGSVKLFHAGVYSFSLEDTFSQKSDSLAAFPITILPDYAPQVRIVKPGADKILGVAQRETLWVEAVDDFGISLLELRYRKSSDPDRTLHQRSVLPPGNQTALVRESVAWDITELSLYPGDSVFYWVVCRDNRPAKKQGFSSSDTFYFRLPTFQEIHNTIAQDQSTAEEQMSSVNTLQKEMQKRVESLIKSTKGKESLSWEEKKILEDLGKSVREQTDSLNKAVRSLQEAIDKMKETLSSKEILDKMDEIQKTLQDLIQQYGDSLFFDKKMMDRNISMHDLTRTLQKVKEMIPDLKERLDNTLKYLNMLKKETERALLAEMAKKLSQQQQQIAQPVSDSSLQMRMQKELSQQIRDFQKNVQKSLNSSESPVSEKDIPSLQQVGDLNQSMQADMNSRNLPSQTSMRHMSAALQSVAGELENTLSSTMAAKALQDRTTLLDMARDVMNMSAWQDQIAAAFSDREPSAMIAAQEQALKESLQKNMRKVDSLEVVQPSLLQNISSAALAASGALQEALKLSGGSAAPQAMKNGTASLNNLAGTLLSTANSLKPDNSGQEGQGQGMMCGLRKLSGRQAAVNAATSELLRQMLSQQPGGAEAQNRDAARQAARKAQQEIADQLDRLSQKYGKESDESLNKRVKELEEEAHRIAHMLENPIPQVQERQDRFLARMLQTTVSLHKQDEGKEERKSTSAVTIFNTGPGAAQMQDAALKKADTYYQLRMHAMDGNFPESYRSRVQAYFDSLGVLFLK